MSDAMQQQHHDERGESIRALLLNPLINNTQSSDVFRLIVRHQSFLVDWFETTLGWRLQVDAAAGFARLFKRSQYPDVSRAIRRNRGQKQAFDRRRYQLLCLVCASLVKYSVTTIGVLARALHEEAQLDTTLKRERSALVDALRKLMEWQVITIRNGDVDAYLESDENNAMVYADTHRLHHLLSSAIAPAKLPADMHSLEACQQLMNEPRYTSALHNDEDITETERLRYARHTAARRLIDDPAVYFDEQPPMVNAYLEQSAARRWLHDRANEAGLELEERREGMLAIDTTSSTSDKRFPSPIGTVGQVALLMIDALIPQHTTGTERHLASLTIDDQQRFIDRLLQQHPRWANSWRVGNEPMRLIKEAATILHEFDLVDIDGNGRVTAKPALARYRVVDSEDNNTTKTHRKTSAPSQPATSAPDQPQPTQQKLL